MGRIQGDGFRSRRRSTDTNMTNFERLLAGENPFVGLSRFQSDGRFLLNVKHYCVGNAVAGGVRGAIILNQTLDREDSLLAKPSRSSPAPRYICRTHDFTYSEASKRREIRASNTHERLRRPTHVEWCRVRRASKNLPHPAQGHRANRTLRPDPQHVRGRRGTHGGWIEAGRDWLSDGHVDSPRVAIESKDVRN